MKSFPLVRSFVPEKVVNDLRGKVGAAASVPSAHDSYGLLNSLYATVYMTPLFHPAYFCPQSTPKSAAESGLVPVGIMYLWYVKAG